MKTEFVIGSRESELALIQTNHVKQLLETKYPQYTFRIVSMTTTGDQIQKIPLQKIGTKALFTKELEIALEENRVDFIVHSLKDVPTELPNGMILGGIMNRKDPRDVVIMNPSHSFKTLQDLPNGSVIGTSSVRRKAQLKKQFPELIIKDVRGNLNTRLKKVHDSSFGYDGIILAYAGIERMGWKHEISQYLDTDIMLYAVGQGALGLECKTNDTTVLELLQSISCVQSTMECTIERSFMKELQGGCSIPLGVSTNTTKIPNGYEIEFIASITSLDGSKQVRYQETRFFTEVDLMGCIDFGVFVGQELLKQGADVILNEIKSL